MPTFDIACNSDHGQPVKAEWEITLYERQPELRAVWRGFCCPTCMRSGLDLLKRRSPEHCLLLVLPVRQ